MQCSTKTKCGVCPGMWLSLVLLAGFAVYTLFIAPRGAPRAPEADVAPRATDAQVPQSPPAAP